MKSIKNWIKAIFLGALISFGTYVKADTAIVSCTTLEVDSVKVAQCRVNGLIKTYTLTTINEELAEDRANRDIQVKRIDRTNGKIATELGTIERLRERKVDQVAAKVDMNEVIDVKLAIKQYCLEEEVARNM